MEIKNDVHYGAEKPANVVYAPDMVYVNIGLHQVEVQREEEKTLEWVADVMRCYTYQEYAELQQTRIEELSDAIIEIDGGGE